MPPQQKTTRWQARLFRTEAAAHASSTPHSGSAPVSNQGFTLPTAFLWRDARAAVSRRPFRRRCAQSFAARRPGASWPSPGAAAAAGSACGAQPVRVRISKVAAMRPSGLGEAFGVDLGGSGEHRAGQRPAGALDQHAGLAHGPQVGHQRQRVVVAHGDAVDVGHRQGEAGALQQARRRRRRRRTARRAGRRRRAAPARPSISAARSSVSVAPPRIAPRKRPSGFSAWRIWISAPTRSLVQCSASDETTRSRLAGANGSRSSSATRRAPRPAGQHGARRGRSRSAGRPWPPRRCRPGRGRRRRRAPRGRRRPGSRGVIASRRSTMSSAARRFRKPARHSPGRRGPGAGGAGRGRRGGAVRSWAPRATPPRAPRAKLAG